MAYDFGRAFQQLFTGGQSDTRNPESVQQAQRGQQMAGGLQQEYADASQNPNYGIGTPAQQQMQERELERSVRDRAGAGGAGGSGYEGDQIRKAIVDFRIHQIGTRQAALNNLRTGMISANQAGWPQPMTQQPGIINQGIGRLAGAGVDALGRDLFGKSDEEAAQGRQRAAELGSQAGGNGMRVGAPGQPGGQAGGPGNVNPWSMGSDR